MDRKPIGYIRDLLGESLRFIPVVAVVVGYAAFRKRPYLIPVYMSIFRVGARKQKQSVIF